MNPLFEVIPAIDIQNGKTVQLVGGLRGTEKYYGDPVQCALQWEEMGAKTVHVVDIDGAFEGELKNKSIIERILEEVGISVQVGGGIRREERVTELIEMGADRVILGTAAIENPKLVEILSKKYPKCIMVSLDSKGREIVVEGWEKKTNLDPIKAAKVYEKLGATSILFTDVDVEGKLEGVRGGVIEEMARSVGIPIVASGGVASLKDLEIFYQAGASAAVVGSALYEGSILFEEIKEWVKGL